MAVVVRGALSRNAGMVSDVVLVRKRAILAVMRPSKRLVVRVESLAVAGSNATKSSA